MPTLKKKKKKVELSLSAFPYEISGYTRRFGYNPSQGNAEHNYIMLTVICISPSWMNSSLFIQPADVVGIAGIADIT